MTDYKAAWRRRTYLNAIQTLGGRCAECGSVEDLQFDHVDPLTKVAEISVAIRDGWSKERLTVELAKCQLLCWDHHKEKTRSNSEHAGGHNKIVDPQHGTAVMYGKQNKCRCETCKAWKREYRAGQVDSLGHVKVAQ